MAAPGAQTSLSSIPTQGRSCLGCGYLGPSAITGGWHFRFPPMGPKMDSQGAAGLWVTSGSMPSRALSFPVASVRLLAPHQPISEGPPCHWLRAGGLERQCPPDSARSSQVSGAWEAPGHSASQNAHNRSGHLPPPTRLQSHLSGPHQSSINCISSSPISE